MSTLVNTAMLRATVFESDALGVLASIIHPLTVGEYEGEVHYGKAVVGTFGITVTEDAEPSSVQIDLNVIAGPNANGLPRKYRATTAKEQVGYAVFYASKGSRGFQVVLRGNGELAFDSRRLQSGDMYAVTLIRPGRYKMHAGRNGLVGRIDVGRAKAGEKFESEARTVAVEEKGFSPDAVAMESGSSVVFALASATNITVALEGEGEATAVRPAGPIRILGRDHRDIERRVEAKRRPAKE
ncbi:MAG: hypothetical protein LCH93_07010 [Proteobacteria bacterium]|nr:hypothetical protein [Pseudomonadota bacterium]